MLFFSAKSPSFTEKKMSLGSSRDYFLAFLFTNFFLKRIHKNLHKIQTGKFLKKN